MGKMTYIYGLVDPRDGLIRYVGKANDPLQRFQRHLRDAVIKYDDRSELSRMERLKGVWLGELLAEGLEPDLIILEQCPRKYWRAWEKFWIRVVDDYCMSLGERIYNVQS